MVDFVTSRLSQAPDGVAPDGTEVRLIGALPGASMARFDLPAGAVSHAVTHRTVEEIWLFLEGEGELWRKHGEREAVIAVAPGVAVTMPLGTHFQFRAGVSGPLRFVAATFPPWPGENEAVRVEGRWAATVD